MKHLRGVAFLELAVVWSGALLCGILPLSAVALGRGGPVGALKAAALVFLAFLSAAVLAATVAVGAKLLADRRIGPGRLALVLCAAVASLVALDWFVPFRFAVVVVMMFLLQALTVCVVGLRPSRRLVLGGLVLAVLLCAAGSAEASLRRSLDVVDQKAGGSLPPQGVLQVVDISNMHLGDLSWNGRQLTATYGFAEGPGTDFTTVDAVEVAVPGIQDPCGPMAYGNGEGIRTAQPSCTQVAPDLWRRGDPGSVLGYVAHRQGATLELSVGGAQYLQGQGADQAIPKGADADTYARTALESAHPLTAAQLNELFPVTRESTWNWLF
ncbi:hypothetical protein [Streptacidiphilus sp. PAMC 29251]